MEYIKFHVDEMNQEHVFFEYRIIEEDKKGTLITRAFPFSKILEKEPKIEELVAGPIIGIYYEQRGSSIVSERQWIDRIEPLEPELIDCILQPRKTVCVADAYDELLTTPTLHDQPADFTQHSHAE